MIARGLGVDLDCALELRDRILRVAERGERDPEDVVRVGIARARVDDLPANPLRLGLLPACVELSRHFDRLGRRDVDPSVLRLGDRLIDRAGTAHRLTLLARRLGLLGSVRAGLRRSLLGCGLRRAAGLAVAHGNSFTRKFR